MLVLIAGVTGGLGQRLAKVAISRGLSVRGLGRSPDNLAPELSGKLESFVKSVSYDDIPALDKAVHGVDTVINAYAPTPLLDLDGHLLLLRAAERAQIKVFVASSWSRDWTNIKFGDFEHYNNHIAFEHQVATTSSIKPVYILSGLFADLLFTQYGPGGFDTSGKQPRMRYWGDGKTDKWPWTAQEDAAEWTIDILLYGDGVQAGKGGFFKISSGVTTIEELAAAYEKVLETKVDVVREGDVQDLDAKLAKLRKDNRTGYIEYMSEAAAMVASKGQWEHKDATVLEQFKQPTSLAQYLAGTKK
jgi:NAD(P)-dependent dehydrogenase (short-subunit alcohol dehydrogenase family)